MTRVNVGCGQRPIPGWNNYDNSISILLARLPLLASVISGLKLLDAPQMEFISFAKEVNIRYANAVRHIPEPSNSVEVLYTNHMLEHLDADEANSFLKEARRVLAPGGVIRIGVPDIKHIVDYYLESGDADYFIAVMQLTPDRPKNLIGKVKRLIAGDRNHKWMYDSNSLRKLVTLAGFNKPMVMEPGTTSILNPEGLDLFERCPGTIFIEPQRP